MGLAESIGSKGYRASNSPSNPALHQPFHVALLYVQLRKSQQQNPNLIYALRPSAKKERQSQIIEIASLYFKMNNPS